MLNQPNYSDTCFDCGQNDCLFETTIAGEVSTNRCPGKESKVSRICPHPECGKRIADSSPTGLYLQDGFTRKGGDASDDPTVIRDGMYESSTAESRTRSAMKLHISYYHPQLAEELGYPAVKVGA